MICACCGRFVDANRWNEVWDGLCGQCSAEERTPCVECKEWIHVDDIESCRECGKDVCNDCHKGHVADHAAQEAEKELS